MLGGHLAQGAFRDLSNLSANGNWIFRFILLLLLVRARF
jgi:hypothetical protein